MITEITPVLGSQIVQGWHNAAKADARRRKLAGLVDACGNEHRLVPLAQIGKGRAAASNIRAEHKCDTTRLEKPSTPLDHGLFQLESRDPIEEEAAGAVIAVINGHLIAEPSKLLGGSETRRAGTNNADARAALGCRCYRCDPTGLESRLGDVLLDGADGHRRVPRLLEHAIALAETILRANATADLGHVVGGGGKLISFLQPPLGGELEPVGNIIVQGTVHLAEGNAALLASRRLFRTDPPVKGAINLVEIHASGFCGTLLRHGMSKIHKLHHLAGHPMPSPIAMC